MPGAEDLKVAPLGLSSGEHPLLIQLLSSEEDGSAKVYGDESKVTSKLCQLRTVFYLFLFCNWKKIRTVLGLLPGSELLMSSWLWRYGIKSSWHCSESAFLVSENVPRALQKRNIKRPWLSEKTHSFSRLQDEAREWRSWRPRKASVISDMHAQ